VINVNQAHIGIGRTSIVWNRPNGESEVIASATNTWTYSYAHIVVNLAMNANPVYQPAYLYVEYANVAEPGNTVTAPIINRADGVNYYLGLSSSSTADFIRIPITSSSLARDLSYTGTQYLPTGLFNQILFQALTVGTHGINGKPFLTSANSTIYGTAVVSAPVPGDVTQDIVWGRSYYLAAQQLVIPATGTVSVNYGLTMP